MRPGLEGLRPSVHLCGPGSPSAKADGRRASAPQPPLQCAALCAPLPADQGWREALGAIAELGIGAVELAAGWTEDPAEPAAVGELQAELVGLGIRVVLLDLPPAPPERAVRALEVARELGAPYVLLPSVHLSAFGAEAMPGLLAGLAARAEEWGATVLLENHPQGLATGESLGRLLTQANRRGLGACFDPAGFVALKRHPFLTEFMPGPLKQYVRCLRLRDALFEDGSEVSPDQGNAELKELVSALEARGYDGWYALSPIGEGSYRQRLTAAHQAATRMLEEL